MVTTSLNNTRLEIAKQDIVSLFESSQSSIFSRRDIELILAEKRAFWRIATTTSVDNFIDFLVKRTLLKRVNLEFPSTKLTRYTWSDVPVEQLALSLKTSCYLSHFSAMHYHALTDQVPQTVYVNTEQRPKPPGQSRLAQESIDRAFQNPQRTSKNIARYRDWRICLLNGMNTGSLGVIEESTSSASNIRVTGLERTLIDITVRPLYSGGVYEVLEAFRRAHNRVSINKLTAMLRRIGFVYPYHQAIGFYLERSGSYRPAQINLFRKFKIKYDFYLTNQMAETEYSKSWRLHFPKGF